MSQYGWNDCPPGVREQVGRMVEDFRRRFGENLLGVYLHGSLAMGSFNPLRSDIDLLVVTRFALRAETKRELAKFFLENSLQPARVEISFLKFDDLRPWRHPAPFEFHYSEDWREHFGNELKAEDSKEWTAEKRFDGDLAGHIYVTRARGICLYGAPISEVFPPVPKRDFIDSILDDVLHPEFGLKSILKNPVYVCLNACRTLAYLETEQVLSKDEGGEWALRHLPADFHPIIKAALDEYREGTNESNLPQEPLPVFAVFLQDKIERAAAAVISRSDF